MTMRVGGGSRDDDDEAGERAPIVAAAAVKSSRAVSQAAEIEYSRTQFYVTRRQWRVLVALTVFNTIALGWLAFAPNSSKWIQDQWQQWQVKRAERAKLRQVVADQTPCLDFVMPATPELLYEEEPTAALKLTSANAGYQPVRTQVNNVLATTAPWSSPAQRVSVPDAWAALAKRSADIDGGLGCNA